MLRSSETVAGKDGGAVFRVLPIVSIVVPFLGLPFRILYIEMVKPRQGTTMETRGKYQNESQVSKSPGREVWNIQP